MSHPKHKRAGPARPGGPSRDRRSAQGRGGSKASDAAGVIQRDFARPTSVNGRPAQSSRTDLNAPPPSTVFLDRDRQPHTFPDSSLKRVAARLLEQRVKPWRYRPFAFPLFTDKGNEQSFHFDFYVYDNMEQVQRLILVLPRESAEVWDKIGRFKRQYPMYRYELWTPEKLAALQRPRASLGF